MVVWVGAADDVCGVLLLFGSGPEPWKLLMHRGCLDAEQDPRDMFRIHHANNGNVSRVSKVASCNDSPSGTCSMVGLAKLLLPYKFDLSTFTFMAGQAVFRIVSHSY